MSSVAPLRGAIFVDKFLEAWLSGPTYSQRQINYIVYFLGVEPNQSRHCVEFSGLNHTVPNKITIISTISSVISAVINHHPILPQVLCR